MFISHSDVRKRQKKAAEEAGKDVVNHIVRDGGECYVSW